MLTYYYIYDIVEPMSMEAITLKAYSKGFLKGHTNERAIRNIRQRQTSDEGRYQKRYRERQRKPRTSRS
ncbi:hypothetical protein JP0072_01440 [Helicobacter pylori]|nr:hypothetical protein JP0072_01440 [Helicobacter pylori]